ncbi:MAG: ABC transporter substrate-binding protein [Chloroflexota bacterium]
MSKYRWARGGIISVLAVVLVSALACGGDDPTATPEPTNTPAAAQPTNTPSGTDPTATPSDTDPTATPSDTDPTATTAPPTATPTPTPGSDADLPQPDNSPGNITYVQDEIPPGVGRGASQAPVELLNYIGAGEAPFSRTEDELVAPMLATDWELEEDLSGGTLTIREGVEFHRDFGELTAEDVAWSVNDANGGTTPDSIHGQAGDFAALFGDNPWEAVDETTVQFTFQQFDPRWNSNFLNEAAQALTIFSKRAFDEEGEDFVRDNIIATGPYVVQEWSEDDRAVLEPVPYDHWRVNPEVSRLEILAAPEGSSRVAMLETGEADGGQVTVLQSPDLTEAGFRTASTGQASQMGVFFSGNLWEEEHAITGEELDNSGAYVHDLPWVGNPFEPNDGNNPDDMACDGTGYPEILDIENSCGDMEQARLVRQALAYAIDRDLINEALLNDMGGPVYVNYFSPDNSRWDDEWNFEYDPERAEELLDEAGYPEDGGTRFQMPFYRQGLAVNLLDELQDAISGFWTDIGIDTELIKVDYSVFRPGVVGRTNTVPWVTACDEGNSTIPWDWPKGLVMTSMTRGGFSCGFESPFIAEKWQEAAAEPDVQARNEINDEVVQYLHDWALNPGVVQVPNFATYNPNSIEEWPMNPAIFTGVNDFESIVPAER